MAINGRKVDPKRFRDFVLPRERVLDHIFKNAIAGFFKALRIHFPEV